MTLSMSKYVLDSFAILAFMQGEQGVERVRGLLRQAENGQVELHMSLINLAEVKYCIIRQRRNVEERLGAVSSLPIAVASADVYIDAVITLKAVHAVTLADCFAAALAIDLGCPLITGDPEFEKLAGTVSVEWLRSER